MAYINKKSENSVKAYVFFGICALIMFLLMSGVFSFLGKEKNFPVPNLVLCIAVIAIAYLNERASLIFAVICGFLCDLFITDPTAFSPIVFLIGALLAKLILHYFSHPGTIAIAVSVLPCLVLRLITDTVIYLVKFNDASFFSVLTSATLLQLAVDFAAAIVISFCTKRIFRFYLR